MTIHQNSIAAYATINLSKREAEVIAALDALIVENRELKMSREVLLRNADKIREQLAARVRFLEREYDALHSQVSGYLHGEDWEHWQKFNSARFNPPNAKDQPGRPSEPPQAPQPIDPPSAASPCWAEQMPPDTTTKEILS